MVLAYVGQRRQELADEIAVCGVDLHPGKTSSLRLDRRVREPLDQETNLRIFQSAGRREQPRHALERDLRWADRIPCDHAGGLTPRMPNLHPQLRPVGLCGIRPSLEAFEVPRIRDDDVVGFGAAAEVGDHVASDQHPGSAPPQTLVQPE